MFRKEKNPMRIIIISPVIPPIMANGMAYKHRMQQKFIREASLSNEGTCMFVIKKPLNLVILGLIIVNLNFVRLDIGIAVFHTVFSLFS